MQLVLEMTIKDENPSVIPIARAEVHVLPGVALKPKKIASITHQFLRSP